MEFNTNIFEQFNSQWALVCAGTMEDHNAMTISWGGMGTLWGKPVVTVYVKPCRHTYQYMNRSEYFTVSFYDDTYRPALALMGSLSGRDTDKDKEAGLHAFAAKNSVSYEEAAVTLVCRKIYWNDLLKENMPEEAIRHHYQTEEPHRMYIGEVIDIIRR
jgi:flavin reductase (DIM6/NTAB) family NADH-FMN oxidoreductase RutF